jgi:hypothetical protein
LTTVDCQATRTEDLNGDNLKLDGLNLNSWRGLNLILMVLLNPATWATSYGRDMRVIIEKKSRKRIHTNCRRGREERC